MKRFAPSGWALGMSVGLAFLAGCGGSQPPIGAPGAPAHGPTATEARPLLRGSYLYVGVCCGALNNGGVKVYDPGQTKVQRRIVRGAADPIAIAVDREGTLYVLNESQGGPEGVSVTEFDRGSSKPSRRIAGFYWATTLALDESNNLYVANCNTCVDSGDKARAPRDSITVYVPGQTKVLKTITQGVHAPDSLAFDRAGNFYVANDPASSGKYHPSVTVYAPESTKLLRRITRGLTSACCLATDEDGDVFVGSGKEGVLEYAPGSSQILRTITDAIAGVDDMVIDTSGVLYVANWPLSQSEPGWISVFQPGSLTAEYKITTGIDQPVALTLDSDGNLYAANLGPREGFVRVYGPHAKRPLRSMKSGSLGSPLAIAVGPRP